MSIGAHSVWAADVTWFDADMSGQGLPEAMVVGPAAVTDGDVTYVVYEGFAMDPYIAAYDASTGEWTGPVKIGDNPLTGSRDRDDAHGAPALYIDHRTGVLNVFWGAHGTSLLHARSARPRDITSWVARPPVAPSATYPQVFAGADGVSHLFYRNDTSNASARGYHGWMHRYSRDGGISWSAPSAVMRGDAVTRWYANFAPAADGGIHVAMVARDLRMGQYDRRGVYYMKGTADGTWRSVTGVRLGAMQGWAGAQSTPIAEPQPATIRGSAVVYSDGQRQNSVVVADDGRGTPGILFVSGVGRGPDSYAWRFARRTAGTWTTRIITRTDQSMDSSALRFDGADDVAVALTAGGTRGVAPVDGTDIDRGGNIGVWRSSDGGGTWSAGPVVAQANAPELVYNDPQFVVPSTPGAVTGPADLVYAEWENDTTNFMRRVFLVAGEKPVSRHVRPVVERLGGADRYSTSVRVSRESHPVCADKVVIASGEVPVDAIVASPLAHAYGAPILLSRRTSVPAAVSAELRRLGPSSIYVVGGTATISDSVLKSLRAMPGVTEVVRISGRNRYETASTVSRYVRAKRFSKRVVVVNAACTGEAAAAGAIAAYKGWPILLVERGWIPPETAGALAAIRPSSTLIVGDTSRVSAPVARTFPAPVRVGGADPHATSAALAVYSKSAGMEFERYAVGNASATSDLLCVAPLAARARGPLLLSGRDALSPEVARLIQAESTSTVRVWTVGGERTLGAAETALRSILGSVR